MSDTKETILAAARPLAQARGYGALSFRELGKLVGVKSASIHHHFPTKGDLGAALARRYREDAEAEQAALMARTQDLAARMDAYVRLFRRALEDSNRMCLCGFMGAEYDELPEAVRAEVRAFQDANVAWLARALAAADAPEAGSGSAGEGDPRAHEARARAIFAALSGAQLVARSRGDIGVYDEVVGAYRAAGLLPG